MSVGAEHWCLLRDVEMYSTLLVQLLEAEDVTASL